MPTTPDLLRLAADLLERRDDISEISVTVYAEVAEIQVRALPVDAQLCETVRGEGGWHYRATLDGVTLVFVELAQAVSK